jgi:hypothetical protein
MSEPRSIESVVIALIRIALLALRRAGFDVPAPANLRLRRTLLEALLTRDERAEPGAPRPRLSGPRQDGHWRQLAVGDRDLS